MFLNNFEKSESKCSYKPGSYKKKRLLKNIRRLNDLVMQRSKALTLATLLRRESNTGVFL